MRHFLSAAAMAMLVSTGAQAGLVKVSFTGTNSSPAAPNVFGTAVPTISGYVIYDDETAGTPFVVNTTRSASRSPSLRSHLPQDCSGMAQCRKATC